MRKPETSDELREAAQELEDLIQHPGWKHLIDRAATDYGAVNVLSRLQGVATNTSAEYIALHTVRLTTARAAAQALLDMPERTAREYRSSAKALDDAARQRKDDQPFGPGVEVTR